MQKHFSLFTYEKAGELFDFVVDLLLIDAMPLRFSCEDKIMN